MIQSLIAVRKPTLTRSFLDALTRGGPGGMPRPIELHAHDSLRYIGDMMAWIHQAVAGEREMVEGLFGKEISEQESAKSPTVSSLAADTAIVGGPVIDSIAFSEDAVAAVVDADIDGTCRPLKVSCTFS